MTTTDNGGTVNTLEMTAEATRAAAFLLSERAKGNTDTLTRILAAKPDLMTPLIYKLAHLYVEEIERWCGSEPEFTLVLQQRAARLMRGADSISKIARSKAARSAPGPTPTNGVNDG